MAGVVPFAATAIGFGVFMDYYGTYCHKSYLVSETKCYLVDARPVGKPGLYVGSATTEAASALTLFYPRNGQVLRGRDIPYSENWIQLLGGSYVQGMHCGVKVLTEVPCPDNMGTKNMCWGPPLPPLEEQPAE
jgi:hypothetical protein